MGILVVEGGWLGVDVGEARLLGLGWVRRCCEPCGLGRGEVTRDRLFIGVC